MLDSDNIIDVYFGSNDGDFDQVGEAGEWLTRH